MRVLDVADLESFPRAAEASDLRAGGLAWCDVKRRLGARLEMERLLEREGQVVVQAITQIGKTKAEVLEKHFLGHPPFAGVPGKRPEFLPRLLARIECPAHEERDLFLQGLNPPRVRVALAAQGIGREHFARGQQRARCAGLRMIARVSSGESQAKGRKVTGSRPRLTCA